MNAKRGILGGVRAPLAITGCGLVTAAGRGIAPLADSLRARRSHFGPLSHIDVSDLPTRKGAAVDIIVGDAEARFVRCVQTALEDALDDAERSRGPLARARTGMALGTTLGLIDELIPATFHHAEERLDVAGPMKDLSRAARLEGPTTVFSLACASGLCAAEQAAADLALYRADAMLVGGADTLGGFMQAGFCSLLGFSGGLREGGRTLVLGEGAAFVVLEPLRDAPARDRASPAVLSSQRLVSDGYHLASPDPSGEGMARAVALALDDAGIAPPDIGAIVLTAVGSPFHERMLKEVFERVLGSGASEIPVTSHELAVGHVLAASSIVALAFAAFLIEQGYVDAGFPLEALGRWAELSPSTLPLRASNVLTASVGFGGFNGVAVVGTPP